MRPKVVLGILAIACALVLGLVVSKVSIPKPPAPAPAPAAQTAPMAAPAPAPVVVTPPVPVATNQNTNAMSAEEHAEYVQKRANDLMGIAMLNDYTAHQEIIREMTNSDPAIRKAALAAVVQTSDRQLIPEIQQIADNTDDPDYKEALQKAIDFMKLPTLTEMMQKAKAQQNGGGNATQPQSQNPGTAPEPGQGMIAPGQ
jgi:hypothetical protein